MQRPSVVILLALMRYGAGMDHEFLLKPCYTMGLALPSKGGRCVLQRQGA